MTHRHKKIAIFLSFIIIFIIFISCKNIQMRIDRYGLNDNADMLLLSLKNQSKNGNSNLASRKKVEDFINNYSLLDIKINYNRELYNKDHRDKFIRSTIHYVEEKHDWKVQLSSKRTITPQVFTFDSGLAMNKKAGAAFFYLWQVAPISHNKAMIWVPGMGVSDFAFNFIDKLIITALEKGYNVALYVPPMHLERKAMNKDAGEGFFSADIIHNVSMINLCVGEIYGIAQYLKDNQATQISGWGGSIGATLLLLSAQMIKYNQITAMIPVLDMNDLLVDNISMTSVVEQYKKINYDKKFLRLAYKKISPIHYPLPVTKENILIQYGLYDQLVSRQTVLDYADKNKLTQIIGYRRSHATILISDKLFEDYSAFQR